MDNLHKYGYVLYHTMRYIKGKCPQRTSTKFQNELIAYVNLWNFSLILLFDEITSENNNISKLKEYIDLNNKHFGKIIDLNVFNEENSELHRIVPLKAISIISEYVSRINIDVINYSENREKINIYLFALHNLPRCLLEPSSNEYICENEAIEYSRSWASKL